MRVEVSRVRPDDVLELVFDGAPPEGTPGFLLKPTGRNKESGAADVALPLRLGQGRAEVALGGVDLPAGTWAVRWTTGGRSPRPVATVDPCYDAADARVYAARARSRAFDAVRTSTGRLRIRVRDVQPHAEVRRVDVTPGDVTVSGFLAYTPELPEGAAAELVVRQRGLDREFTLPAQVSGRAFTAAVALGPLAAAHDPARERDEWDLWLRLPGSAEVRLASRCDDVTGKKGKVGFPGARVRTDRGTVELRPYYTTKDAFSLLGVRTPQGAEPVPEAI